MCILIKRAQRINSIEKEESLSVQGMCTGKHMVLPRASKRNVFETQPINIIIIIIIIIITPTNSTKFTHVACYIGLELISGNQ